MNLKRVDMAALAKMTINSQFWEWGHTPKTH